MIQLFFCLSLHHISLCQLKPITFFNVFWKNFFFHLKKNLRSKRSSADDTLSTFEVDRSLRFPHVFLLNNFSRHFFERVPTKTWSIFQFWNMINNFMVINTVINDNRDFTFFELTRGKSFRKKNRVWKKKTFFVNRSNHWMHGHHLCWNNCPPLENTLAAMQAMLSPEKEKKEFFQTIQQSRYDHQAREVRWNQSPKNQPL